MVSCITFSIAGARGSSFSCTSIAADASYANAIIIAVSVYFTFGFLTSSVRISGSASRTAAVRSMSFTVAFSTYVTRSFDEARIDTYTVVARIAIWTL